MAETLFERMSKAQSQTDPIHSPDVLAREPSMALSCLDDAANGAGWCDARMRFDANDIDLIVKAMLQYAEERVAAALTERDSHAGVADDLSYDDAAEALIAAADLGPCEIGPKVARAAGFAMKLVREMDDEEKAAIRAMPLPDGV